MRFILVIGLMFFLCFMLQAEKVSGIEFPDKIEADGENLIFIGGGTRTRCFVSIYHSGLYLKNKINNGENVVNDNLPMAVRMYFVYSLVKKEKIISVWNECFDNVTDGRIDPIKTEVASFCHLFGFEDVKNGDVFELVFTPEKGVSVIKNSKQLGYVKGLPFKKALFSVWFGNKPIQENLKTGMLGAK